MARPQGGFQPPPVHPVLRVGPNQIDPILLGRIESPPLSLVRNTTLPFLQFNCMSGYDPNETPSRAIGWAHPDLVGLLRHAGSTIYVDSSLRKLPPGFAKCLAVVVHDRMSGFCVPVFYVLCTTRTLASYRDALYFVFHATKRKLKPNEVVCDFDSELYSALRAQFPNAVVKGSVYLLKKACRTRMEQLELSEEAVNIAMEKGALDMLASIRPDRVATAGIAWVKRQIKSKCAGAAVPYAQDEWRSFWCYFRHVWLAQFPPDVWNVHGLTDSIIARTNNPLEHFQRELDAALAAPDPGLQFFVATIERMARRHVADLAAETTTLPNAVEVHSEVEAPSDSGTESDGDESRADVITTEPSRGHGGSSDEDESEEERRLV